MLELFVLETCPYCKKAEKLLQEKGLKYKKIDITNNEKEYRKRLGEYYKIEGRVTVPQIIIGNKRIGGCDDIYDLNVTGKLDELLND